MPEVQVPDKLLVFLFILLRDHLTAGEVSEILACHVAKLDTDPGVVFSCPSVPWLPEAARDLAERLLEPGTFFTIGGIEDDKFPSWHPAVIKYFDRASAEGMMELMKKYELLPQEANVAEHPTSILKPACMLPPEGWRCTRGAGHEGPCAIAGLHSTRESLITNLMLTIIVDAQ